MVVEWPGNNASASLFLRIYTMCQLQPILVNAPKHVAKRQTGSFVKAFAVRILEHNHTDEDYQLHNSTKRTGRVVWSRRAQWWHHPQTTHRTGWESKYQFQHRIDWRDRSHMYGLDFGVKVCVCMCNVSINLKRKSRLYFDLWSVDHKPAAPRLKRKYPRLTFNSSFHLHIQSPFRR